LELDPARPRRRQHPVGGGVRVHHPASPRASRDRRKWPRSPIRPAESLRWPDQRSAGPHLPATSGPHQQLPSPPIPAPPPATRCQ
jgi:hypothetical protein